MSGHLRQTVAIRNLEPQSPDGTLEVASDTWGVGGNFGLLYAPAPATRLGVTYTSPVKLKSFPSAPGLGGLGAGDELSDPRGRRPGHRDPRPGDEGPQTVMLGFSQTIGERWTLLGDVGWQNWAAFGAVEIGISTPNPRGLTTQIKLPGYLARRARGGGAALRAVEAELRSRGPTSSMTTDENRSLSLALAGQFRLGVGAQVAVDRHSDLGFATELLLHGSPRVDVDRGLLAGHVSGAYSSTWIFFTAFSFTWKARAPARTCAAHARARSTSSVTRASSPSRIAE